MYSHPQRPRDKSGRGKVKKGERKKKLGREKFPPIFDFFPFLTFSRPTGSSKMMCSVFLKNLPRVDYGFSVFSYCKRFFRLIMNKGVIDK